MNLNENDPPFVSLKNIAEITLVCSGSAIKPSNGIKDHDCPLSPVGLDQVSTLARQLESFSFDLVLCSSFLRALVTSRIITDCENPMVLSELDPQEGVVDQKVWARETAKAIVTKADQAAAEIGHPVNVFVGVHHEYQKALALAIIEQLPNQENKNVECIRESVGCHSPEEADAIRLNIFNQDQPILIIFN